MWERMRKWFVVTRQNCRGGRYEANIYSKTYTEGSDPFELTEKHGFEECKSILTSTTDNQQHHKSGIICSR